MNRREFLSITAAGAAASVVPRHVLGGPGYVAPSDKVTVGYVGCGSQGLRHLMPALAHPGLQIVAVCDPNRRGDDYPMWGPGELNYKVQVFLDDPTWAQGARAGLCGREVGQEIVNRHYGKQNASGVSSDCRAYADWREMLAQESDLDAVYNMTPEHHHGTIGFHALRAGKHILQHKSLANVLHEARLLRDTARQVDRATQMFCDAGSQDTPTIAEWIWSGAIGPVREVHNWSSRPFWPQGMTHRPTTSPPVPEGLDWDLWLGPVPDLPYSPEYTNAVFRGWYDFGTGALGDMGHYSFHQIFKILKLGFPTTVEASRSQYWGIRNFAWGKETNTVSYPRASLVHWEFPAREDMPPVRLTWYDGGLRPPIPEELERDGEAMPEEGLLFVGDDGKILCGFSGDDPRLLPKARMEAFTPPPQTLARPIEELDQWVRACQGGERSEANYEVVYPFAETILLGTIALRQDKKLLWDTEQMAFTNAPEANALIHRTYRSGWEI